MFLPGTASPSLLQGTLERFGGPEALGVCPCYWSSTGTPGHQTGSSHGHWRLVSPGRQRCLASHSGLANLNVNLVTKLITDTPSPARVACPLGSALRRLTKHLRSPWLVVFSCWLGPSRHGRTRLVARLLVGAGGWCPCQGSKKR